MLDQWGDLPLLFTPNTPIPDSDMTCVTLISNSIENEWISVVPTKIFCDHYKMSPEPYASLL